MAAPKKSSPTAASEAKTVETKSSTGDANERSLHYKEEGNRFYTNKEFSKAATAYRLGLALYSKPTDESDSNDLEVALRSNLAMVLLKLEKHEEARTECHAAIILSSKTIATAQQPKLWYRRALAHEGLHDWKNAIADLKECIKLFGEDGDKKQRKAAHDAIARIEPKYKQQQEQHASAAAGDPTGTTHDYIQQRTTVLTLLQSRQALLQPDLTKEGEAFFLLDWAWWRRWCQKVQLFPKENGKKDAYKAILAVLPAGAVYPTPAEGDDDESEEIGPIDNSSIVVDEDDAYRQHWYTIGGKQTLRPNLVRGHDYEVIPREVYQAITTWYGESSSTSPICRRTTAEGMLELYPEKKSFGTSDEDHFRHVCGACRAPHAKSWCKQCSAVYYCSRVCQQSHWLIHKSQCTKVNAIGDKGGKVGLHNLGNTCFMNSALQCLSHATPLTRHFLSNAFLDDLNTQNPLGTGGKLANAYNQVLREVWMAGPSATSPTTLKRAIAMFAPRFAGCSQHDAQEFLAYLLDGLHEDLNRIRKAPYVELPDVEENSDMAIAGAEAWNAHRRRNDSLVMDTFYGQFKSTCVCPQCKKVSVSFDAFNHVSLEIPQPQSNRFIPIIVFSGNKAPVRWMVEVQRGCFVGDLRKALASQCGIAAERIAMCDLYEYAIYEILKDQKNVNAIRATDVVAAFDVDPYTNTTVHAVATHYTMIKDDAAEGKLKKELFGFPFLTSFPASLTCRQVYQHFWTQVKHVAGVKEEWMQVCVTENDGKVRPVFEEKTSAVVPSECDDSIMDYLGEDVTERFLFVSLEWEDSNKLDKSAFVTVIDHSSYTEGLKKERAAGAKRGVTLDQCFQTFTRPERLDENNKWYCNKCKDHVRAMKTMELWRLPNVLVVHLKRFEFKHALRRDKLDTFVDFDVEGLDMSQYCGLSQSKDDFVKDKVPAIYDLFAVTNHFGRLGSGHYTAFARSWDEQKGMSKEWALFDDSSVRPVPANSVVTSAGYVLFYRRRQFS